MSFSASPMLYCYLIARFEPEIETVGYRTLQSLPIRWIRNGELVAAARWAPAGTRSTPELMLEYNAVLAAAGKRATVLPVPFGTRFRSEAAIVRLLGERRRELLAAIEQLEGKVEMVVRLPVAAGSQAEDTAAEIGAICRPLESREIGRASCRERV